ncbi:MAG: glycerophosphodiester phosphodiesterase [Gammaproteobacteria bacterium]|nr:MAG: glycerophosphodiester phosphodiesterase [Gammaproteobacteria bacterium]
MEIIGHRGARSEAPENTLAGFLHLQSLGIQSVELDLRLSRDFELMIIHDESVDRTTDQTGKVFQFSASELERMDARGQQWQDRTYNEETGVPLLRKLLKRWPALKSIQLEVKSPDRSHFEILGNGLMTLCQHFGLKGTITSSDLGFLQHLNSAQCPLTLGYVAKTMEPDPIQTALQLHCQHLIAQGDLCSSEWVTQAHDASLKVSAWTVNDEETFRHFERIGVDSVITDQPSLFQELIRQKTLPN